MPYGTSTVQAEDDSVSTNDEKKPNDFPKRNIERQELISQKTDISNTYLNADGSFTKEIYPEPIQFQDTSGTWKSIKNELKESKKNKFTFENEENSFKTFFNDEAKFHLEEDDYEITFALQNVEKIKPTANKNLLGYKNIFKSTDLNYTIYSSSIKEELILKNKQSPTTFSYKIGTKGLNPKLNDDYSISFLDKSEEKYRMNPFFAYDANEQLAPKIVPTLEKENDVYILNISLDKNYS